MFDPYLMNKGGELCIYLQTLPWRDSISRPIAPVSSKTGGDDTTRPRSQGQICFNAWKYPKLTPPIDLINKYLLV
jgi:hypothetical protein